MKSEEVCRKAMGEYLDSFGILSHEEIKQVTQRGVYKHLNKGEYFITEGKICKEVAYVRTGIFRSFYTSSSSEEVTYCLSFSNKFFTAYSSFLTQEKTAENVEALTDIEMLVIPRQFILELEKSSINWVKFFKLQAEQEYLNLEQRFFLMQRESALKRYQDLMQNQPQLIQEIPLKHLASYLGITQRHLSRIRTSI